AKGARAMVEARDSRSATATSAAPWAALLLLIVGARLAVDAESLRLVILRTVLLLTAAAEAMAGLMYVFRARGMAEPAGRRYAADYHGVMQDFGFYNLTIALLLVLCATDPVRGRVVLFAAVALYAVHGATHVLRYFGCYYGGETRIPSRPRHLELRDAL